MRRLQWRPNLYVNIRQTVDSFNYKLTLDNEVIESGKCKTRPDAEAAVLKALEKINLDPHDILEIGKGLTFDRGFNILKKRLLSTTFNLYVSGNNKRE